MNSKGRKDMFIGLALGLVFPLFGFLVYGLYWSWRFNKTMTYFARDLFLEIPGFTSSILSLCLLANLIPFLFFIRRDRYKAAQGVLLAVFCFVPAIIYFRFS